MTVSQDGSVAAAERRRRSAGGAALVAAGIFLSRVMGLVRSHYFTRFLGTSDSADAFTAAMRIPNFLQNLFGEGVLSASFIPVYARLLAEGDEEEAGRVAGAVFSLLALVATVLVVIGIFTAPYLIDLLTPGFTGDKRELTVKLVQVMFPGVGLLVLSAWCLGILNSHRRFFHLVRVARGVERRDDRGAARVRRQGGAGKPGDARRRGVGRRGGTAARGAASDALQAREEAARVAGHQGGQRARRHHQLRARLLRPRRGPGQRVRRSMARVVPGRGGCRGALYAQVIAMLPISLFGMAIAASELPAMSSATGDGDAAASEIRQRLDEGLRRIAFYIIPSGAAFLLLGDIVAGAIYQNGQFMRDGTVWVWGVLAGSAVGLLAGTMGRLYSSAWYAQRDTVTPLKFAMIRVALTLVLGYVAALRLPHWLGISPKWGVAGLTASAGIAGWVEFWLLRRAMNRKIGVTGVPLRRVATLWLAALSPRFPRSA